MPEIYDWSSFYTALCQQGPTLLMGIDDETREMILNLASTTDIFWSDGLQELLAEGTADGNLRAGVMAAINLWRENVLQVLADDFALELDWQTVRIDKTSPLVDELVEAAMPG